MGLNEKEQALLEILKEKNGALQTILEITRMQEAMFSDDDVTALMDNIELRQQWIDHVNKLDGQISAFKDFADLSRPPLNAEYTGIQAALNDITRQDAVNEKKALQKLEGYKQELKTARAEKTGFDGYYANNIKTGESYFDEGY